MVRFGGEDQAIAVARAVERLALPGAEPAILFGKRKPEQALLTARFDETGHVKERLPLDHTSPDDAHEATLLDHIEHARRSRGRGEKDRGLQAGDAAEASRSISSSGTT